jgi:hypothetical protein
MMSLAERGVGIAEYALLQPSALRGKPELIYCADYTLLDISDITVGGQGLH